MQHSRFARAASKLVAAATIVSMAAAVLPASAASPTSIVDTLDRVKISVSATHSLAMTLPAGGITTGNTLTITYTGFGTDFAGTPTVTCGAGTATAGFATNVLTLTGGGTPCTGALTVTPFTGTNPGTAGSYTISLAGSAGISGQFALGIVNDDQVSVTATVDPSLTFNVGSQAAGGSNCTGAFSANGGSVALGTLSTGSITSSDVSSVTHICSRVSTNATGGAVVTVKSLNGALKSTATPADTIPSVTAAMAAGTANYGLCASATRSGMDTTTPTGATPTRVSPFNSTCAEDTAAGSVGALTTSAQTVWSVSGPSSNAYMNMIVKAAISGTTVAHTDYSDTLTFVATGTF